MKRVLFVVPTAQLGGAATTISTVLPALWRHGWTGSVVILEEGPLVDQLRTLGVDAAVLAAGRVRNSVAMASVIRRIARHAEADSVEVIVSHMGKGHLYGGFAARRAGVPALWWQHTVPTETRSGERVIDWFASKLPAAAVICGSEQSATVQQRLYPTRPVRKIVQGIDVAHVVGARGTGRDIRTELLPRGGCLIGTLGRLERGKGQDVFLRAAAQIARHRPDARFLIIGGADFSHDGFSAELATLVQELGLSSLVQFTGRVDAPWKWLDACDVVMQLSEREGFGNALIEALVLERAVVATRAGVAADLLDERFLVPFGDHSAAAATAVELLRQRPDTRIAEAAVRASHHSASRMVHSFCALLDEVAVNGRLG